MSSPRKNGSATKEPEKSRPIFSRRIWTGTGSVDCAVFSKTVDSDGQEFQVFNVSVKRTWKDDVGYQSSNAFRPEDLLPLAFALNECYTAILNEQAKR